MDSAVAVQTKGLVLALYCSTKRSMLRTRALTLEKVGDAFDVAESHGEKGSGPLKRLDLALLID